MDEMTLIVPALAFYHGRSQEMQLSNPANSSNHRGISND